MTEKMMSDEEYVEYGKMLELYGVTEKGTPVMDIANIEMFPTWGIDNTERSPGELRGFWNVPWISTCYSGAKDTKFTVQCLDGGAWDRPTMLNQFDTMEEAQAYCIGLYDSGSGYRKVTDEYEAIGISKYLHPVAKVIDDELVLFRDLDYLNMEHFGWLPLDEKEQAEADKPQDNDE